MWPLICKLNVNKNKTFAFHHKNEVRKGQLALFVSVFSLSETSLSKAFAQNSKGRENKDLEVHKVPASSVGTWRNSVYECTCVNLLRTSTNHHMKLLSRKEYDEQLPKYVKTLNGLSNRSDL